MHLIYLDNSGDDQLVIFSALAIPIDQWHAAFRQVRDFRRMLKKAYGIHIHKELHAWEFVSGRGNISDRVVTKWQRCTIFKEVLGLAGKLPEVGLFNAVFPKSQDERALERMLNRVNRTMKAWRSHSILISDKGKESAYTRLVRKMYVFNPIQSQYGTWRDTGATWKNIPLDRIVEDPFFKDSSQSYFVQLVDFAAYALLRRERPLASKSKYGLDQAFAYLTPILVREANRRDPWGIIRP